MISTRRGFLGLLAAPAIVQFANIMPVRAIERLTLGNGPLFTFDGFGLPRETWLIIHCSDRDGNQFAKVLDRGGSLQMAGPVKLDRIEASIDQQPKGFMIERPKMFEMGMQPRVLLEGDTYHIGPNFGGDDES